MQMTHPLSARLYQPARLEYLHRTFNQKDSQYPLDTKQEKMGSLFPEQLSQQAMTRCLFLNIQIVELQAVKHRHSLKHTQKNADAMWADQVHIYTKNNLVIYYLGTKSTLTTALTKYAGISLINQEHEVAEKI